MSNQISAIDKAIETIQASHKKMVEVVVPFHARPLAFKANLIYALQKRGMTGFVFSFEKMGDGHTILHCEKPVVKVEG